MIKGSWKKYLKGFDKDLQYKVKSELQNGLDCESFSVEDLKLWSLDDFIIFVEDVKSYDL